MLFCTNRWEKKKSILSTLKGGDTIVCDRYAFSGVAYSAAKGLDLNWCKNGDIGLPRPDIVFYMKVTPEFAAQRGGYGEER
jgi:dTMP kinase